MNLQRNPLDFAEAKSRRDGGVLRAGGILIGMAGLAALLLGGVVYAMWRLSWPHVEPEGSPQFGISFSCNHAEYLLLEDPATGSAGYADDGRPGRAQWCAETL